MTNTAPSTVAMSAWNWLATQDGPRTFGNMLQGIRRMWLAELEETELSEALEEGRSRGRLIEVLPSVWDIADAVERRIVVDRDRSGDGWAGWKLGRLQQATAAVPFEEVIP